MKWKWRVTVAVVSEFETTFVEVKGEAKNRRGAERLADQAVDSVEGEAYLWAALVHKAG